MTAYPQLSPQFYTEEDKGLKNMMEYYYAQAITLNQSFWSEADVDTRFEANDQTLWNDLFGNLPAFKAKQFSFNRIRRIINMITGYQRRNRKSTIVIPTESADDITASQFSKVMFWANQRSNALETISKAFHGACVTGLNLLHYYMDYHQDPISGDICVENVPYNGFIIDPFFKSHELSDCNFIWRRSWLTPKQIIALIPDRASEIAGIEPTGYSDGRFQFQPESYNYGMKNLLPYDEFWYRDFREQTVIIDTQSGETMEWSGREEDLNQFLRDFPQVTVTKTQIPTVRLGITVQDRVMYHGPNPMDIDNYPFVPVMGYYNPQMPYFPWRIQGVVRGLRDAQYLYNRRKVIELSMLESQVTTGWIFKENALVNPKDVYLYGQGRGIALKQEAQMTDIQQIPPPQVPPSMIQLSEFLGREIQEISGVSDELLGMAEDDQAGVLSMLRQGAGLTTLQILFDQLDFSQKMGGRIMLQLIQKNFTPGKIKRITNEEPSKEFYTKAFGKYDCSVEEGLNTTNQKQMQFVQLMELKKMGIPVPTKVLLEASTMQNKQELIEAITQEEQQAAQMQQQMQQVQMQDIQSKINLANARAVADTGLGYERASRIMENQALAIERQAEAQKDDANATLDMIRAVKELQGLDLDQIIKSLQIVDSVRRHTQEQEAQTYGKETMGAAPSDLSPERYNPSVARGNQALQQPQSEAGLQFLSQGE
jgi:hypothetical protein